MAFCYEQVVPWGRSFDEYRGMFALTEQDLQKRILGCADGPASFNCTCNERGGRVVSIDPIYALSERQIAERIDATFDNVIAQTENNREKFRWDSIRSVEELGRIRMSAMRRFLASYEEGKARGAYVPGSLPKTDFPDDSFDIALCSHFLFLYSANLTYAFHCEAIHEMLRVAPEARIFPLLDVNAEKSPYVDRVVSELSDYHIRIRRVEYEFQVGGNEMMIVARKASGIILDEKESSHGDTEPQTMEEA